MDQPGEHPATNGPPAEPHAAVGTADAREAATQVDPETEAAAPAGDGGSDMLEHVLRWGLLGLLVLVPLVVFYWAHNPFEIKEVVLVGGVALCSLGWLWVALVNEVNRVRLDFIRVVLAVNVAVWLASLALSAYPGAGLSTLSVRLACAGFLLLTPALVTRRRHLTLAVAMLAGVAGLMSLYGILQFLRIDPFLDTEGLVGHFRVSSTSVHPNIFITFLIGTIPLTVAGLFLLSGVRRARLLLAASLALQVGAAVATLSRAGWGGLILMAVWLGAGLAWAFRPDPDEDLGPPVVTPRPVTPGRPIARVVIPLLLVVLTVVGLGLSRGVLDPGERERLLNLEGPTTQKRKLIYQTGLRMAADHPLLGKGLGTFAHFVPAYRDIELARYFPRNTYHVEHAVSEPVEVLAESGGLGLLAWVLLVAAFVFRPLRAAGRVEDRGLRAVLVAASAGVVGMAAHGSLEVSLRYLPPLLLFWALPALALCAERVGGGERPAARSLSLGAWPGRLSASVVVGMTFGLAFAFSVSDFVANIYVSSGRRAVAAGALVDGERSLRRAEQVWQGNLTARYNRAYVLWKLGHLAEAEQEYRAVAARSPHFFDVNHNLARVLLEQGKVGEADTWAGRAIKGNPFHVPSHELAVRLAVRGGRLEEAEQLGRRILDVASHHPEAHVALARALLARGRVGEARGVLEAAHRRFPDHRGIAGLLAEAGGGSR